LTTSNSRVVGNVALGLSLLTFGIYFLNVLFGGPLGRKPWMSDVSEMLVLFLAVLLFVAGTLAREAEAKASKAEAIRDGKQASERSPPSPTD
jgi:hypothetical protein